MSVYSISVKKGDLQYSIAGVDKDFVAAHIDMVFKGLKDAASGVGDIEATKLDISPVATLEAEKYVEPVEVTESDSADVTESNNLSDLSSLLMPSENKSDNESEPETQQGQEQPLLNEVSETQEEIEINETVVIEPPVAGSGETAVAGSDETYTPQSSNGFESILEEKMNNFEAVENVDLETVVSRVNPDTNTDYLIITAYYMTENDGAASFQLKQLNSKLYNSMKIMIDRKTVQSAIDEGLLETVFDADDNIIRYKLTTAGREYYANINA